MDDDNSEYHTSDHEEEDVDDNAMEELVDEYDEEVEVEDDHDNESTGGETRNALAVEEILDEGTWYYH